MKNHEKLNHLVVSAVSWYEERGMNPTARDVFVMIKEENPVITKRGFKSFVKLINANPEIIKEGENPAIYKSKN